MKERTSPPARSLLEVALMGERMKRYVLAADRDDNSNASGVRPTHSPIHERPTGKVPRVDLDRLLEAERERARDEERARRDEGDRTRVIVRAAVLPPPFAIEEAPLPLSYQRPLTMPPPVPPFEAMRAARDDARRTKRIVLAIWAFALTLAGSLGYFVASQS